MRSAQTVGFSIDTRDRSRLEHLTEVFGSGNRSEFLRKAMSVMERMEAADTLVRIQAYGQRQGERQGVDPKDIPALVEAALTSPDQRAVAEAKLICASSFSSRPARRSSESGGGELSDVERFVRGTPTSASA